jgi:hypothetical protein
VSPLARDRVRAFENPAIHHDAAARAGAEDDAKHDLRSGGRAIDRFGQCETVGIIGEADGPIEQLREVVRQRLTDEPG